MSQDGLATPNRTLRSLTAGRCLAWAARSVVFWTNTCINSLRPLPYVKSWAANYKNAGLVVIGVRTPEFSFEKEPRNIENAVRDLKVTYPVAIDSNYRIWQAFNNHYWPAQYFIDGKAEFVITISVRATMAISSV